jgi:hypothetical protein
MLPVCEIILFRAVRLILLGPGQRQAGHSMRSGV